MYYFHVFAIHYSVLQCIVGYTLSGEEAISHAELMLPMICHRTSKDKVIVRRQPYRCAMTSHDIQYNGGVFFQALEALVRLDLNHIRKEVRNEI